MITEAAGVVDTIACVPPVDANTYLLVRRLAVVTTRHVQYTFGQPRDYSRLGAARPSDRDGHTRGLGAARPSAKRAVKEDGTGGVEECLVVER